MRKEMPNERICFQSPVWACPVYLSLSSRNADLQTFSPSFDNALAFVSYLYYHLSKGDGYFLLRLLPRWGLSEQLDCPIDRGSRDSAL